MVDIQTSLNIELFPAFILLWWWDWHNSLRYIKLQVNNKRLCSQGVLVFKWITLVTSVSQGDLWFSYNFHIDIIYHSSELSKSLSCLSDNRSGRCGQCVRPIKHLPDLHIFYNFNWITHILAKSIKWSVWLKSYPRLNFQVCLQLQVIPWNTQS